MAKSRSPSKQPSGGLEALPKPAGVPILDGQVMLVFQGGEADGQRIELDLFCAKLAIEVVERKFATYSKDWVATPEFLKELAAAFQTVGVPNCTPSAAYQLWGVVAQHFHDLKKNMRLTPSLPTSTE